jgi:methyltransferase (TIGR00027 family)
MKEGLASRTAFGVALRRAKHQLVDKPPIFVDPIAVRIVGENSEILNDALRRESEISRPLRAFLAARSRYAEDQLAQRVGSGTRQCVILGAGLDTFAYRNPHAPELQVFEVDHPNTQRWKRGRLRQAGIRIPESLTFIPVDFENQNLEQALAGTPEFDRDEPAFFSWLGVTPYLTNDAFWATIRTIVTMPAGSAVVFDYAVKPALFDFAGRLALWRISKRVARAGEPFHLFFTPTELISSLRQAGFRSFEDLGRDEINALYFHGRTDRLRVSGNLGRLLCART